MDQVFKHQIERNIKVYIDDILVKLTKIKELISDLKETSSILQRYDLKLNPNKCIFGVKGGHFLGYMAMERGIKVNQEKAQASQNMQSPQTTRAV